MNFDIAGFILGISVGIMIHRIIMGFVLRKSSDDICSYCEWMARKKSHRNW